MRHFEDFTIGETIDLGAVEPERMTEAAMIAFAAAYDPQPFHLDPEAGRASLLGGLAASGWHTNALGMRLFYLGLVRETAGLGAPGIADCRWLKPVFPSERAGPLSGSVDITGLRPSTSRPEMGFVSLVTTLKQRDPAAPDAPPRPVSTQSFDVMMRRREPGAPAAPGAPKPPPERTPTPQAPSMAESAEMRRALIEGDPSAMLGVRLDLGAVDVTADEIIAFAEAFDPQPFHLSEEGGRASLFGGLCASGWHTTALYMSRLVRAIGAAVAAATAESRAGAASVFGPAIGFTDLKWLQPVRPGDRIRFFTTAQSLEPFGSRGSWSLMRALNEGWTEAGQPVMRFNSESLVLRPK